MIVKLAAVRINGMVDRLQLSQQIRENVYCLFQQILSQRAALFFNRHRTLRAQKNIMKCPSCTNDISDFLQNPQVNRELMTVIESLHRQTKEMEEIVELSEETYDADGKKVEPSEEENDGTKSDVVVGDAEICHTNTKMLEEDKEGIMKPQSETKPKQEEEAANGGEDEVGVEPEMCDHKELQESGKNNKTNRRKKASEGICSSTTLDTGIRTRSKKAKLMAADDA